MNQIEQYEFDRLGYLVIPGLLTSAQVAPLAAAVDRVEAHAVAHLCEPPRKQGVGRYEFHDNPELGYRATGSNEPGQTIIIDDFINADPAFDFLVNHERTMQYIGAVVQGRIRINNSEIRLRYPGNATSTHMGGPIDHKYRYAFTGGAIDCMMVRMIYFIYDVGPENGPFCVVPGSHKSNFASPYEGCPPDDEPGMVELTARAGDAILFTENLRHGGFINHSGQTRKTLHIGFGPYWMMSQNLSSMDEPQHVLATTLARYDEAQRKLLEL